MRLLYSLVLYLIAPLVVLRLLWRSRKAPDYRQRIGERFGFFPHLSKKGYIWLHSVSVGETIAAAPLVKQLLATYPDLPLLITTTTPTGSAQVKKLFGDQVAHVYAPYDLPGAVQRFLARTQPRLALIMETELWPNLFHYCHRQGVPVVVANARLSERSAKGYGKLRALTAQTLACVTQVAAQGEDDGQRFLALGLRQDQLTITGSLKFDLTVAASVQEQGQVLRRVTLGAERPVWLAASTHQGEDEQLLDALAEVRQQVADALLVLVPRHPERFDSVVELCRQRGLNVVRRSERRGCNAETDVFVADSMGEMMLLLAASDVCFMGGSLIEHGGHNILEPAALGKPVVFGPSMYNFAVISKLFIAEGAARQVADRHELAQVLVQWLTNVVLADEFGQRGRAVVDANRGALQRLLRLLAAILPPADS